MPEKTSSLRNVFPPFFNLAWSPKIRKLRRCIMHWRICTFERRVSSFHQFDVKVQRAIQNCLFAIHSIRGTRDAQILHEQTSERWIVIVRDILCSPYTTLPRTPPRWKFTLIESHKMSIRYTKLATHTTYKLCYQSRRQKKPACVPKTQKNRWSSQHDTWHAVTSWKKNRFPQGFQSSATQSAQAEAIATYPEGRKRHTTSTMQWRMSDASKSESTQGLRVFASLCCLEEEECLPCWLPIHYESCGNRDVRSWRHPVEKGFLMLPNSMKKIHRTRNRGGKERKKR